MSKQIEILTQVDEGASLPSYGSLLSAGADVCAHLKQELVLKAGASALIPTGLKVEIPKGYEIQVRPRSGMALKYQVTVLNTPGTIDADYRGEICVILINHGNEDFIIEPGMRIAQLILAPVIQARFVECEEELATTTRGSGGFGHTGLH